MNDTYPKQTTERERAPQVEAVRVGMDLKEWKDRTNELMAQNARIIALRGAGTVNGIEPAAAQRSVDMLREYINQVTADGTPVALMFDGDGDNRAKPDVGSVFGGLVDALEDNLNVTAIAAQTEGWYSPAVGGSAIENASGKPYETYVFPDELPGSHASLTQSDELVAYPNYEQVFVGPAGPIAFSQLQDLNEKTAGRPESEGAVKVTILETSNNPDVQGELTAKLHAAEGDPEAFEKVAAKLAQREEHPYGALFTRDGEFDVDSEAYPGIAFSVAKV